MRMSKETKESLTIYGTILMAMTLFIFFGFVVGETYNRHHSKSIDTQHEELMLKGEYKYCPYCGEELER